VSRHGARPSGVPVAGWTGMGPWIAGTEPAASAAGSCTGHPATASRHSANPCLIRHRSAPPVARAETPGWVRPCIIWRDGGRGNHLPPSRAPRWWTRSHHRPAGADGAGRNPGGGPGPGCAPPAPGAVRTGSPGQARPSRHTGRPHPPPRPRPHGRRRGNGRWRCPPRERHSPPAARGPVGSRAGQMGSP
jgi:hypothetical protein